MFNTKCIKAQKQLYTYVSGKGVRQTEPRTKIRHANGIKTMRKCTNASGADSECPNKVTGEARLPAQTDNAAAGSRRQ